MGYVYYLQQFLKRIPTAFLLLLALPVPAADSADGGQSLGQAANDPTASMMATQIQDSYTGNFHQLKDEDANTVILRPVVPFA